MTKKEKVPEKIKKAIRDKIYKYQKLLNALDYRGDIRYIKKDEGDKDEDGNVIGHVLAKAIVDHRYLIADFEIFPRFVKKIKEKQISPESIDEIIAHEVAHIATQKLYYMATSIYKDEGETKDAWESLTTVIGRLLVDLGEKK